MQKYICIDCKSILFFDEKSYRCKKCDSTYNIINDIPVFIKESYYFGETDLATMKCIINDAYTIGYKNSIKKHIKDQFVFKYIDDESRSIWINIIPHDTNSIFADIGCGWGTNSIPISKEVKILYAIDIIIERVLFAKIKSEQENVKNIIFLNASAIKLPLENSSVDVVAFNGVIEWLGGIDKSIDPVILQSMALNETRRVLKQNKYIYIGIENRFS